MLKKIAVVFFIIVLIASMIPTAALADSDTTPPTLVSVTADKTEYVASDQSEDSIVITVSGTDQSGVASSCGYLYSFVYIKNKATSEEKHFFLKTTSTPGTLSATINVKDVFRTGDYYVSEVDLVDTCNNCRHYSSSEFPCRAPEFHVTNTARTDFDGPVLTSLTVDKATATVGDTLTFTATADDSSGVRTIGLHLKYGEQYFGSMIYLNPTDAGTLQGTLTITDTMPDAAYSIGEAITVDYLENSTWYCADFSDEGHQLLPESMRCPITVSNPLLSGAEKPELKSVLLSRSDAKQGDTVRIDVTFDTNGTVLSQNNMLTAYLHKTSGNGGGITLALFKNDDNSYFINWPVDAFLQPGDYRIDRVDVMYNDDLYAQFFYDDNDPLNPLFPTIHISSVFSGTENLSLPLNTTFDPKAGVTAANDAQGDLTNDINISGDVNTQQVGIYLVKYMVKSNQTDGYGNPCYYQDFRWVGVTETAPTSSDGSGTLVVTNDAVNIGAASNDVSLTKDGRSVSFSSSMDSPGNYSITAKGSGVQGTKAKAGFIIDRSGPSISPSWSGVSSKSITVSANCKDLSGVSLTKWIAGSASLARTRVSGKTFSGSFTVSRFGCYTIYAKDKLGNESVKVVNVKNILVTKISLNKKTIMLKKGGTCLLKATFAPANATYRNVTWYSRNTAVAVVDANGKVKALKKGSAYIYVKTANGKTARCLVTVR